MGKKLSNILGIVVSTLLGAALIAWIYRGFDFSVIAGIFTLRDNHVWILLALLSGVAANVLRSLRWRMLLASAGIRIKRRRAVELVFISYLINSVTPRLGELTRSLLVKRGNVAVFTRALGTVVIEKLADVACLCVVVGAAVALRWDDTVGLVGSFSQGVQAIVPSYALYVAFGALVCLFLGLSLPLRRRVRSFVGNLCQGISAIMRLRRPWAFAGLCAAIWFCNFMQLYLLIPCFIELSSLDWDAALHLFAAASVGLLLPTPGGAGPWHYAIVKILTGVYHADAAAAKSFALVTHGLKTALVMLLGLLAYLTFYWEILARMRRYMKRNRRET